MRRNKVDNRQDIAFRAYRIWEAAGRPDGRALDHWLQAEAELAARRIQNPAAGEGAPAPAIRRRSAKVPKAAAARRRQRR